MSEPKATFNVEHDIRYDIRKFVGEAQRRALGSRHAHELQAAASIAGALAFAIVDLADALRERSS